MTFTREDIIEYKKLHLKDNGEELSDDEAIDAMTNLYNFLNCLIEIDLSKRQSDATA